MTWRMPGTASRRHVAPASRALLAGTAPALASLSQEGVRSATDALEFLFRPIDHLLRRVTGHDARGHPRDHVLAPDLHADVRRRARADDVVFGIMVGAHRVIVERALRRLEFGPDRQIRHRQKSPDVIARRPTPQPAHTLPP